jgi:hypothetical protein
MVEADTTICAASFLRWRVLQYRLEQRDPERGTGVIAYETAIPIASAALERDANRARD